MNTKELPKNEIDEIIKTLLKYKKLSIAITVIVMTIATIYAFAIQKPIYKATALIQIAKQNTFILEENSALRERLISKYRIYTDPNQPLPRIIEVNKPPYSTGFLQFTATSYSKNRLKELLNSSIGEIIEEHNSSIDNYIKNQKSIISQSEDTIKMLHTQIEQLKEKNIKSNDILNGLENTQLAQIAIHSVSIIKRESDIIRLEDRVQRELNHLNALKVTLKPNRTFNTKLVNPIDIHPRPITPRKSLIVAIGFVSGVLLSILISLFLGFLDRRRG
jgi:LPS O-antigen subunit length determinant protein (WzzB/FepE family)